MKDSKNSYGSGNLFSVIPWLVDHDIALLHGSIPPMSSPSSLDRRFQKQ
ncbi:MAG: hypothetical protein AB8V70_06230 [Rickettsia conorii subsp. raoultii]